MHGIGWDIRPPSIALGWVKTTSPCLTSERMLAKEAIIVTKARSQVTSMSGPRNGMCYLGFHYEFNCNTFIPLSFLRIQIKIK